MGRIANQLTRVERAFDNRIHKVLPATSTDELVRQHESIARLRSYLGDPVVSLADYIEHCRRSEKLDACEMIATGCTREEAGIRRLCRSMNERGANTTIERVRAFLVAHVALRESLEADMLAGVPVSESAAAAQYFRYQDESKP